MTNSGGENNLKYVSLGFEIAAGLGVPIGIGFWIDRTWATMPWFTFAGIILGVSVTIMLMVRLANNQE
ncbi:AtpZ/AtpI family protein [Rhodohalobacter sp. 8-1]|uniref:AtpZ/AtpI family protein n=1 Tax=Rhodohalobacter sp. 8-1 TaxID=3131972 RepID=UPI0030EB7A5A